MKYVEQLHGVVDVLRATYRGEDVLRAIHPGEDALRATYPGEDALIFFGTL